MVRLVIWDVPRQFLSYTAVAEANYEVSVVGRQKPDGVMTWKLFMHCRLFVGELHLSPVDSLTENQ